MKAVTHLCGRLIFQRRSGAAADKPALQMPTEGTAVTCVFLGKPILSKCSFSS